VEATPATAPALELAEIQGNIPGFLKPHQRFVFLSFPDKQAAQGFLHALVREIDTAGDVADFNRRFKFDRDHGHKLPTASWFNLALTFPAIQLLEAPELESFEQAFRDGMKARSQLLGDVDGSDPANWTPTFQGQLHAVAILAADDPGDIEKLSTQLGHHIHAHNVVELGREDGNIRPGDQAGREHFGYKDGASQPGIQGLTDSAELKPGQEMIAAGEFILGYPNQDSQAPAPPPPSGYSPTPAPTPTFPSWAKNGSMLVFRRLRQDVRGFNDFVAQTAGQTGLRPDLLEAKLVGRYKSGAPLEVTKDEPEGFDPQAADPSIADPSILDPAKINNFEYEPQDADGHVVPRGAHIRKAYPRNENPPGKPEAERHRILRRGIPYGPEFQSSEGPYPGSGNPPDDQDRGLLFACYQSSIERGFEFIQTQWANKEGFPQAGDGSDAIISQDKAQPTLSIPPDHHLTLQRWVITTGGEYFLSPSISALRMLAGEGPAA
jgi:Dyp-type peroxidase family